MTNIDTYQEKYSPATTKEYITGLINKSNVDFHSIICEAKDITLKEVSIKKTYYQDKNWIANTFNGNMIGLFRDYYPHLMKIDKHKRWYLELAPDVRVFFKKLDEFYKPNNVKTKHVENLWSHSTEGLSKIHTIYMGYVLENNDWTKLRGIYASYPNNFFNKKIDWVIDMIDFATIIKFPLEHNQNTPEEIIITPKTIERTAHL